MDVVRITGIVCTRQFDNMEDTLGLESGKAGVRDNLSRSCGGGKACDQQNIRAEQEYEIYQWFHSEGASTEANG